MSENSNSSSVPGRVGSTAKPGGKEMRRYDHVRVRLGHASKGNTVQVRLFEEEKEVLAKAADILGYERGLSTFIRQLGLEAAAGFTGAAEDRITAAAEESGMAAGEWLRTIALAAIRFSPLKEQIDLAWEAYRTPGRLPHNAAEIEQDYAEADAAKAKKRVAKKGRRK